MDTVDRSFSEVKMARRLSTEKRCRKIGICSVLDPNGLEVQGTERIC